MDMAVNLKRRSDSGDSIADEGEKKHHKKHHKNKHPPYLNLRGTKK